MKLLSHGDVTPEDGALSSARQRLEELVDLHRGYIRQIVNRLTPASLGVASGDIEQEVMIRLWRSIRNEREIRDFRSYVYRVVATAALDALREVKARHEEPLPEHEVMELREHRSSPEELAGRRTLLARIRALVATLATNRRRAVKLHLQGFTSTEIAVIEGWSEPKARNLTYRGLGDLRELLRKGGLEYE